MAKTAMPKTRRVVLTGVTWKGYLRLLRIHDTRRVRVSYDRGIVEIMTLSSQHERYKHLLGRLVEALTDELAWNIAGFGSMTFKRKVWKKGMEPDDVFWIQNEPAIRGKDKIDILKDPPPDLGLENDVTRRAVNRLGIYAVMKVPEVWIYKKGKIRVLLLGPKRKYVESERSRAFPFLPIAELERFLAMRTGMGETDLIRLFRQWVRERIAAGWQ